MVLFILLPLYLMVKISLSPTAEVLTPHPSFGLRAVAALFAWLESWNEFTYALYLSLIENTLALQTYYYVTRANWFDAAT